MILSEGHELKAAVMNRMWSYGRAVQVSELLPDLWRDRTVSPALVTKLLNRLHRAGWLRRELVDGIYFYEPTASREEYCERLMREALAPGGTSASVFVIRLPSTRSAQRPVRCALS